MDGGDPPAGITWVFTALAALGACDVMSALRRVFTPSERMLTPAEAREIDAAAIEVYNAHPRRRPEHLLHTRAGAFVPTSNILTAPVVLLYSNPGYSPDPVETPDLCEQFAIEGWPFGHLHDAAPQGARDWTRQNLKWLIESYDTHFIANAVACAQLTPWASVRFHDGLRLPSRPRILDIVGEAARRGALMIVMRGRSYWEPVLAGARVVMARNPRCAAVSPGNLDQFDEVRATLDRYAHGARVHRGAS